MKDGYLLDTNIISTLIDSRREPKHSLYREKIAGSTLFLPVMSIAEIEFGMAVTEGGNESQKAQVREFFARFPQHLGFGDNTVEPYAVLRAQLWKTHATREKRSFKEKWPEELIDKTTGKELGIEEAAQKLQEDGKSVNLKIAYW